MWLETIRFGIEEIKNIMTKNSEKKQRGYDAIEAIYLAANETKAFLSDGQHELSHPNRDLSQIWMNAAAKVRELDIDLYWRLLGKAEYWSNPSDWTRDRIENANITLDGVREDARRILDQK